MNLATLALVLAPAQDLLLVSVADREGESFCSVSAGRAPTRRLLSELCAKSHVTLAGLELVPETAMSSVDLRNRPLHLTLEWIAGNVGLRPIWRGDTCELAQLVPHGATPTQLRELALDAYRDALRSFPSPDDAARAELEQALIHLRAGEEEAALRGFDVLVISHAQSPLALDAAHRAAKILLARSDFAGAAERYSNLLRLGPSLELEIEARTQLAHCTALIGDYAVALRMVRALDTRRAPRDAADEALRSIVRARCEIGLGRLEDGRAELARVCEADVAPEHAVDLAEVRALAIPDGTPPQTAAQTWLEVARLAHDTRRDTALVRAASLAASTGNPLDVLAVSRFAERNGLGDIVARFDREARAALGITPGSEADPLVVRLARAERLAGAGAFADALSVCEALLAEQTSLAPAARARLHMNLARSRAGLGDFDGAIDALRRGVVTLDEETERRGLYLLAAELYERQERFDDAIEAYRGKL
jgi:tetratricopeptide (TPR) repeat protein